MIGNELLNGIASVRNAIDAFNILKEDVVDYDTLQYETARIITMLCQNNPSLRQNKDLNEDDISCELGKVTLPFPDSVIISHTLNNKLPQFIENNSISFSIKTTLNQNFAVVLEVDEYSDTVSEIAEKILFSALENKSTYNFRCSDTVKGGIFFTATHKLITSLPEKSSGKVYKSSAEFDNLLKQFEEISSENISKLGSFYNSVTDYNANNDVKLKEFVNVIYINSSSINNTGIHALKVLLENRVKNGMNFIIAAEKSIAEQFADNSDCYLKFQPNNMLAGYNAELPFTMSATNLEFEKRAEEIISNMQKATAINTVFSQLPNINSEYLTMDSADVLRIPFALDENGLLQHFEIGGEAPAHALLSGSTGSGKSVALHTLIMQIIRNYHPDDVEIWAIDYKAVEFDWYITHNAPHFRVVAHDTSVEFSLSLLDMLYEEYEDRKNKFLETGVKNIGEYRKKMGAHSMPRIIVVIDEFQLMTQHVQAYTGNKDYRTVLENLLRETRATGISFVFCSQTIASGLSGLTESAREQIGVRLSLKHGDDREIRETLMLSGENASEIVLRAKNLRKGQGIYKRTLLSGETSADNKSYEYKNSYILYLSDDVKEKAISDVIDILDGDFTPKKEVFVRGGGRIPVSEKARHPLNCILNSNYVPKKNCVEWYPSAPTTLADGFCVDLENSSGANILLAGENDELRDSIVFHSICGFLMNPKNRIVFSFIDENFDDRKRMIEMLKKINSERLEINVGLEETFKAISSLKKIRPNYEQNTVFCWYGLEKLKNEIFLMDQDDDLQEDTPDKSSENMSKEELLADLKSYLAGINGLSESKPKFSETLNYEDCCRILKQAFEVGPENNIYHMVIFNNFKAIKKSGMINLESFENRIGSRMSTDDSYALFNSSSAINATNDKTVIYYTGSGQAIPLRPYLMPDDTWLENYNKTLNRLI